MYRKELKTFICIADCGSFNKAAERLYLSPTAIMKQLNALEDSLNLKLLERTSQGIALTSIGEAFYQEAKYMVSYSDQVRERLSQMDSKEKKIFRMGSSLLYSCDIFMQLWNKINDKFPQYKIQVVPLDIKHADMLRIMKKCGSAFDFIVGVFDSSRVLSICDFLPLGTWKKCVAVSRSHPLSKKRMLELEDLHGETLVMVGEGDSPVNDALRNDLRTNHPQIHIQDTAFFLDMDVFNYCDTTGKVMLNVECWKNIHPNLVTIPVNWNYEIPYGVLYSKDSSDEVKRFLEEIKNTSELRIDPFPPEESPPDFYG